MTTDTKRGGLSPANDEVSVSPSGRTGDFFKSDIDTMHTVEEGHDFIPQYSILKHTWHPYATVPVHCHQWLTPECEHTEDAPWCMNLSCFCHYDNVRMERSFIQPIERGELSIAEAIDLYHGEPGYMARKQIAVTAMEVR